MPEYLRGYCDRAATNAAAPGTPIRFVASTQGIKRDGQDLALAQWSLENFQRNPVFLWVHDYAGSKAPIGRVEISRDETNQRLIGDVTFDQEDEFARQIESKYRRGFMNAVSVGWDSVAPAGRSLRDAKPEEIVNDLLDLSAVPVPGDPDALAIRQKRALAALGHEFLKLAGDEDDPLYAATRQNAASPNESDPVPPARATWPEDAAAMARLFRPFAQRPDSEREQEYKRLARAYARHGKTPPEFLPQTELDALAVDDIRAHFLEGEPELAADVFAGMGSRAGAVLSRKNQDDLEQIVTLAQGILTRARKEADQSDDEHAATEALRQLRAVFEKDQRRP